MAVVLPSAVDMSIDLMPTMAAAATLMREGGLDTLFAMELADALSFGWKADEDQIRRTNDVMGLDPTLPSWLLSTFRDGHRTEVVLVNYGLLPLHAAFIARAMPCAVRLSRIVIHFANFGDTGVEALATAIARANCPVRDLHLVEVGMGDRGAAALGAALTTNRSLDLLILENNYIHDVGANALAAGIAKNRGLAELKLSENYISPEAIAHLTATWKDCNRKVAYLKTGHQKHAVASTEHRGAPAKDEYHILNADHAVAFAKAQRSGRTWSRR